MSQAVPHLSISTAPFLKSGLSTPRLMYEVLASLMLVVAAATWFFGIAALLIVTTAVLGAVLAEWLFTPARDGRSPLRDGSAALTGVLLALTLPPATPLWMVFCGAVIGIVLGKSIWGGLGGNLFNPALVGRAFLQGAFPLTLTTWTAPGGPGAELPPGLLAAPFARGADVVTTATPLGLAKFGGQLTELPPLFLGGTAGSLGETSGLVLLVCGAWLALRRAFDWRLPVATLAAVALAGGTLHLIRPEHHPDPLFMIGSGGLLFAAVFMVTDPVTTPLTPRGSWIFGAGVGLLVVLIREFGGLPEGVMYAILLMNGVTPLINRSTQPRRFGG